MTKYSSSISGSTDTRRSLTFAARRRSRPSIHSRRWSSFRCGLRRKARPCRAEGKSSDCVLKPVAVFPDAARTNGVLVMCEVMMPDGKTPHPSNKRATILDDAGAWFGFEQEYFFYKDGRPLGFPASGYPAPQGPYYTGVGYSNVGASPARSSRSISILPGRRHQPRGHQRRSGEGPVGIPDLRQGVQEGADEMWMARYLMQRLTESYGIDIEYHCKPLGDTDWNGSGMPRQLLHRLYAGGRRQGLFRKADWLCSRRRAPITSGLWPGQSSAADRQARDRVDQRVQLWRCRSRRVDPRAA